MPCLASASRTNRLPWPCGRRRTVRRDEAIGSCPIQWRPTQHKLMAKLERSFSGACSLTEKRRTEQLQGKADARLPLRGLCMRVTTGGDWSIGFGSDRSLEAALIYRRLGEGLRQGYTEILNEPLPEHFHGLIEQLSENSGDLDETSLASPPHGQHQEKA